MVTCNTTVSKQNGILGLVECLFLHRYSHNLKHIQMVSEARDNPGSRELFSPQIDR